MRFGYTQNGSVFVKNCAFYGQFGLISFAAFASLREIVVVLPQTLRRHSQSGAEKVQLPKRIPARVHNAIDVVKNSYPLPPRLKIPYRVSEELRASTMCTRERRDLPILLLSAEKGGDLRK